MARNKRSVLSEKEIIDMLPERWKKSESVTEIQARARKGYEKVSSLKCSLNDIWNIFKSYPECFLFRDYVAEIQKNYIDFHTYKFGRHAVQEFNMQSAVSKMISAIKSIYGDVEKQLEEQKQKDISTQIIKEVLEEDDRPLGINLFDDEEDEIMEKQETKGKENIKLSQKGPYKLLYQSLRIKFKDDITPIEEFIPANGQKIHSYLIKKNVSTLGDFMNLMLDPVGYARFSRIGSWFRDQYNDFSKNVLNYVNKKVAQENGLDFEETLQNTTQKESAGFFDNLSKIPSENFVKDSEKMDSISKQVGDYLKELTDYYFNQGMSTEEIDKIMESEIANFHAIVDKKREENSKKVAASKIKAKIDDGVKYKQNLNEINKNDSKHSHNRFGREF